jgi:hypothetical protein
MVGPGHLVLTLFDSGSDAELISKSFIENAGLVKRLHRLSSPRSLVGIGGGLTIAKEEVMLQWTFSNKSPTLPLRCFVAETGLGYFDLLLGRGFLFEHRILVLQAPRLEKAHLFVAMQNAMEKEATAHDIDDQRDHQDKQMGVRDSNALKQIIAERIQRERRFRRDKPPPYREIADMSHRQSEGTLRHVASSLDGSTNVAGSEISHEDAKPFLTGKSPADANLEVSNVGILPHPDSLPLAEPVHLLPEQTPRKLADQPKQEEQNPSEKAQSMPGPPKPMDETVKNGQTVHSSELGTGVSRESLVPNAASKSLESDSTLPPNQEIQQPDSTTEAPIALGIDLPAPAQSSTVHGSTASAPDAGGGPEQKAAFPALSPAGTELSEAETAVESTSPAPAGDADKRKALERFAAVVV